MVSIKFRNRKTPIHGFVVDYTDDWTFMKYNPVDYVIDGYILVRNKYVEGIRRDADEKWREKVIRLKGLQPTDKDILPLTDLESILKYLTAHFGVFQLYTKSENACYLGRLHSIDHQELVMDDLNPKGKWDGQIKFSTGDIRVIEFDTDYINSLKLVSAARKEKKSRPLEAE